MLEVADDPGETVTEDGLKLTETPEGTFEAERLTVMDEPDPLVDVTVTVGSTYTVPLDGLTDIEKSFMYSVSVVDLVTPPPEPVIVTVYVPREADEEADIVSVLVKVGVPLGRSNDAVTPLGSPEAESETVPDPLISVTVTVAVLLAPLQTERLDGLTDIEKSNGALIVSV